MFQMKNKTAVMAVLWATVILIHGSFAADPPASQPAGDAGATLLPVPPNLHEKIPPARTRTEVSDILGKSPHRDKPDSDIRPCHIVLLAGPKDHGPGEHDYPAWQKAWQTLLSAAPKTKVTTAWEKPSSEDLAAADVIVIFKHTSWPAELNSDIERFLARGGGIVLLHFAVDCAANPTAGEKQLGLYWGPGAKFRHGWLDLEFRDREGTFGDNKEAFPNHAETSANAKAQPFLRGLTGKTIRFHDESYWRLTGDPASIDVLATAVEDDGDGHQVRIPLVWNRTVGKGRIHVNILGHYNWTFNDPIFRTLVMRGIAWAAGEPIDRFNDLVIVDVKVKE